MIESNMDNGDDFNESLKRSIQEFGLSNLLETQEATLYLLTLKSKKMKKNISIIAIVSALFVLLGIVFKFNHFPGANYLFIAGVIACAALVFPGMAFLEIKNTDNNVKRGTVFSGYSAAILLSLATLFKFMHWPGFFSMYYIGLSILVFAFIPMYTFKNYRTTENKLFAIAKSMLIIAGIAIFWASYKMIDLTIQTAALY
jgi:uncharacterized membrane protein